MSVLTLDSLPFDVPLGPLVGGVLIGLAASLMLAGIGRIMGVSGVVFGMLDRAQWRSGQAWRLAFVIGLVLAGGFWVLGTGHDARVGRALHPAMLAASGLLVGWGTSLGSGCTSGHGVCGLGRRSLRSLVAVLIFMATGALTVFLVRHGIGSPT